MFPVAAIVVLGCKVHDDGRPSAALARRILLGLRAFEEGVAERIIASGGRRWNNHAEADCIAAELTKRGVDPSCIDRELRSQTTVENAQFSARRLPRQSRIVLATSSWHMPRATRAFQRAQLQVIQPPTSWNLSPKPSPRLRLREFFSQRIDEALVAADRLR